MKRFLALLIGIIFLLTLPTFLQSPGSSVDGQTRATGASSSKKKAKPATEEAQPSESQSGDEEEKEEEEPEEEEPSESEPSEEPPAPVVDEPPSSSPGSSQGPGQFYVCSKCGFTTDSEGDCPKCGIALEPMK